MKKEAKTKSNEIKQESKQGLVKSMHKIAYNKGITLIALVVTIVILLILAGVSINGIFGENGLIKLAQEAGIKTKLSQLEDLANLKYLNKQMNQWINGTDEDITMQQVVNELKEEGYDIIIDTGGKKVRELIINPESISMHTRRTTSIDVSYKLEQGTSIFYTLVDGKYYEMKLEDGRITVSREESKVNIGEIKEPEITVRSSATNIATVKLEGVTVTVAAMDKEGQSTITVEYGGKVRKCEVSVEAQVVLTKADIGKYVNYETKGQSYTVLASETGTSDIPEDTEDAEELAMRNKDQVFNPDPDMKWKIWDVDDEKLTLIGSKVTNDKLYLYGEKGYNNSIEIMDKVCSANYGDGNIIFNTHSLIPVGGREYEVTVGTSERKSDYLPGEDSRLDFDDSLLVGKFYWQYEGDGESTAGEWRNEMNILKFYRKVGIIGIKRQRMDGLVLRESGRSMWRVSSDDRNSAHEFRSL